MAGVSHCSQFGSKEEPERSDEPLLVLVSGPAALDREDAMDVGRERQVGHVDRVGEFEIWVKGFEGG